MYYLTSYYPDIANYAIKMILFVSLLFGIYNASLMQLVHGWGGDYSYAYIIPFVCIYIAWEKRKELFALPNEMASFGLIPLIFGIALYWIGELGGEFFTLYVSFWLSLVGIVWVTTGYRVLRSIVFPLFLLITVFRIPNFLYNKISVQLQLLSSEFGVFLLRLIGHSAYREGNIIDLGFTQLQVIDACSGLRYIIPLLVLSIIITYFIKQPLWKKVFLVLSALPLAILVNSIRISLTGIVSETWGRKAAEGFFHDFSGWLIFMVSFGVLLGETWAVSRFPTVQIPPTPPFTKGGETGFPSVHPEVSKGERQRDPSMLRYLSTNGSGRLPEDGRQIPPGPPLTNGGETGFPSVHPEVSKGERQRDPSMLRYLSTNGSGRLPADGRQILPVPPFTKGGERRRVTWISLPTLLAVFLLGATWFLSSGFEFREQVPSIKPFSQFPHMVGEWTGTNEYLEENELNQLDLSDYALIDFQNPPGQSVNFYVAYYQSQRKGESIHSPETCLPGSGWLFQETGTVPLSWESPKGRQQVRVKRALMQKLGDKRLVYFWFPQRGRILTSAWQLKWFAFLDALTLHRTDGALVRIITPVYQSENLAQAESRISEFTKLVFPILAGFIPGKNAS